MWLGNGHFETSCRAVQTAGRQVDHNPQVELAVYRVLMEIELYTARFLTTLKLE
jgi:hypothetical protein